MIAAARGAELARATLATLLTYAYARQYTQTPLKHECTLSCSFIETSIDHLHSLENVVPHLAELTFALPALKTPSLCQKSQKLQTKLATDHGGETGQTMRSSSMNKNGLDSTSS